MPRLNKLLASLVALALLAAPAVSCAAFHSEPVLSVASHAHDPAEGQSACGGNLCCSVCLFTLTSMPNLADTSSLKRLRSEPFPAHLLAGIEPETADPPPRYSFH